MEQISRLLKPGIKIKRWLLLMLLGVLALLFALLILLWEFLPLLPFGPIEAKWLWGFYLLLVGILALYLGCRQLLERLVTALLPEKRGRIANLLLEESVKEKGPKIVVIGGGTGSYQALMGLKQYSRNLTAVVSMADSGGSTGRLRNEYGVLPPGDVRRCLIALSEETPLMQKLFQHRFGKGSLEGHNFGNLFLTALENITGSDEKAILEASNILNIKGKVFPVTLDNSHLHAELENGQVIVGESNIDIPKHNPNLKIRKVFLKPKAKAYHNAIQAIMDAEMIVIGPGDIYTSIIPNLLVQGIPESMKKSKAIKVYVCNLMTKQGETTNYTASMHLKEIMKYVGFPVDYIILNNKVPEKRLLRKYEQEHSFLVKNDIEEIERVGVKAMQGDMLKEPVLVRHDPEKLAKAILEIGAQERV
ncbi:YvcK family protein [Candidatus Woesearchaeota archaeon]|nr:YvcK family protein [Candidatus Woesearchaeota archaeon]